MADITADLHPGCESLAFLLGTWAGRGAGEYPTIEPFSYNETVTFGHVGKPFLSYNQKSKDASSGQPLHAEVGYLRAVGDQRVELVVVQPSGILEVHTGTVDGTSLEMTCAAVHTTPTALSVTDVVRRISVVDDALTYTVAMAAVGVPLTHHLAATLQHQ